MVLTTLVFPVGCAVSSGPLADLVSVFASCCQPPESCHLCVVNMVWFLTGTSAKTRCLHLGPLTPVRGCWCRIPGCLPAVSALCPFGIAHSLLKSLSEAAGGLVPTVVPQCSVCTVFALRLPAYCLDCRAV